MKKKDKYLYAFLCGKLTIKFKEIEEKVYFEESVSVLEYSESFIKATEYAKRLNISMNLFLQLILMKKQAYFVELVFLCRT